MTSNLVVDRAEWVFFGAAKDDYQDVRPSFHWQVLSSDSGMYPRVIQSTSFQEEHQVRSTFLMQIWIEVG